MGLVLLCFNCFAPVQTYVAPGVLNETFVQSKSIERLGSNYRIIKLGQLNEWNRTLIVLANVLLYTCVKTDYFVACHNTFCLRRMRWHSINLYLSY